MGTPEFSVPCLKAILPYVSCVYTQPPKPKNRGHHLTKTPIHLVAEETGIEVRHPLSLKQETLPECDLVVVVAYGLLLPSHILHAPKRGCVNIHASLLPRWRGAAPIQRAIMEGDLETGITIMQMDEGLDTGDMLLKKSLPIKSHTTYQSLYEDLSHLGAELLLETLKHPFSPTKQPLEGVTYAGKIQKEESTLDVMWSSDHILRYIHALNPWPGTRFDHHDFKIIKASKGPEIDLLPGTFFDHVFMACGEEEVFVLKFCNALADPLLMLNLL